MNHTETPWKKASYNLIRGPHGEPIASTAGFALPRPCDEQVEANTNHILRCVNSYDELVSRLDNLISAIEEHAGDSEEIRERLLHCPGMTNAKDYLNKLAQIEHMEHTKGPWSV